MTNEELLALLDQSRRSNQKLGITGMLLYKNGIFVQILEGEERTVASLFEKISQDPRHSGSHILLLGEEANRQFPNWSMGFKNLSLQSNEDIPGFTSFLSHDSGSDEGGRQARTAYRLLLRFRELPDVAGTT